MHELLPAINENNQSVLVFQFFQFLTVQLLTDHAHIKILSVKMKTIAVHKVHFIIADDAELLVERPQYTCIVCDNTFYCTIFFQVSYLRDHTMQLFSQNVGDLQINLQTQCFLLFQKNRHSGEC